MTWPVRRVRIFLLWAFCCGLAGPFASSAHADGPALTAVFGIAGRYRPGAWCPVTVSIKNPTSDSIAGQIQVLGDADANHGSYGTGGNRELGSALYARPVTLSAAPGAQTFQLDTRGLDPGHDGIIVQLVEGRERGDGRVLAQIKTQDTNTSRAVSGIPVADSDPFLIGFGGDPGAFTYLSGQKLGLVHQPGGGLGNGSAQTPNATGMNGSPGFSGSAPPTVQVAEASGSDLPDKAAGYGGVDAFLLRSDAPLDALTEAQADALKGWVAGGGHLIVCGGVDASRFGASFFSGLLPASVGAARPAVTLPGAGAVGAMTLTPKPLPGVRVLASAGDGTPLVITGPYGAGSVTLTAYDPTVKAFQSPAFDTASLWQTLLTRGPASSSPLLPFVAAHEENYHANIFYGGPPQLFADAVMRGPSLDAPGTEVIGLFLLVYLIALVPANYLILKRLDRKELAWVTIPLLVLFFAVGTFGVGYAAKGGAVFVNRAAIVETSAGRREAAVYAELGLFSPHRTAYDLTLPGANILAAIPNRGFNAGFRGGGSSDPQSYGLTKFVQTPEGGSALDASVNMWAMRAFDVQATADLGGTVDGTLAVKPLPPPQHTLQERYIGGRVTNHTAYTLNDCCLIYHGDAQALGDLGAGSSISIAFWAFSAANGAMLGLPIPPVRGATQANNNSGDIHARMRGALADFVRSLGSQNNGNYYGNPMQAPATYTPSPGEALLLGWSDDSALAGPGPRVDGQAVKENDVTLVVIHLPVKGATIMVAAPPPPSRFPGMIRTFRYPSQQAIASRTVGLGATTRNAPAYTQAMEAHNLALAQHSLGRAGRFHGIVNQVLEDPPHQTLTLTFDPQYSRALTAVLTFRGYSRFPNMQSLRGREVVVSGPLIRYQDKMAIMLSQPGQIQVVH